MSRNHIHVSESELEILKVIWAKGEAITAQDVSEALAERDWKYSTIATLLGRMVEKGAVTYEKRGRFYYYTPTISREEYKKTETRNFISKLYDGSVKNLVVSLFENEEITDQEIEEIKKQFDL